MNRCAPAPADGGEDARMNIRKILLDPKTILGAVIGGFIIGLFARPVGEAMLPIGTIYIAFLSMCLMPILITAIVTGIARLLRDPSTRVLFKTMAVYYLVGLILPCVVGIMTALLLGPGIDLGPETEESIGLLIIVALSTNQVMSIVFLSVCVGLAMGLIQTRAIEQALDLAQTVYETFMQLFRWAIVILAPGLLFLISGVVAQIDAETLLALTKFVVTFYVGGVVLLIIYMVLFWLAVRGPVLETLSKLSNPTVLAFMTNNPIIALPAALETLERDYGIDRRVPELVVPFGIFANQHGAVFLLSFLTVFLAQIYVIDLGIQEYLVIAIGSIIAGATAVGGGAVLIPTVAPILGAVGIPMSLALVVLATTDNIIGPLRTALTLQCNITLTVMTARPGKEMPVPEERGDNPESEAS